jgi:esterase/lipase superfamily enzyme
MSALQALEGLDRAHLLAHSMGARVVIDALEPLPDPAGAGQWPRFAYLVFAAPDVSTDVFKQQNGRARRFADRETLYASDGDWAIRTSSRIHKAPRAGQGGASDIIVLKDLDSVDASGVDAWASIGHAYVFSVPRGVADLRALLVDDAMPEKRGLIREEKDLLPYWRLAP